MQYPFAVWIADGSVTGLLIGKDGGEKLRQQNKIDSKTMFAAIDVMPMRRMEMQQKSK